MRYLYLDHNVYIETLENLLLKQCLINLSDKEIQCLYSPAHIEEIYKVSADAASPFKVKMKYLLDNIHEITNDWETLPSSLAGVILEQEHPKKCYLKVKSVDTRDKVKVDSILKMGIDKDNFNKLVAADRHNQSISNNNYEEIWRVPLVKKIIQELNDNKDYIIMKHNLSIEVQLLSCKGINKKISEKFSFRQGEFYRLKESNKELEYIMEILFRVLSYVGYYSDKEENTAISGTHDVTHAIYATKADCFISTDKRFVQRCKAVYFYLGVDTKVKYCKQSEIMDKIASL